jgi:hypothetical protein
MTTRQSSRSDRTALAAALLPPAAVSASGNPRSTYLDGRVELIIHPVRQSA